MEVVVLRVLTMRDLLVTVASFVTVLSFVVVFVGIVVSFFVEVTYLN